MKFVLLLLVVAVVLWWVGRPRGSGRTAAPKAAPRLEAMVACARCGVHLPRSDAVSRDGRWYCGAAHADAGLREGARSEP